MSSKILEGLWELEPSSAWALNAISPPSFISGSSLGTQISAKSSEPPSSSFAQLRLTDFQNLTQIQEIRFWLRSSRLGDGHSGRPFYLIFEVEGDPVGIVWSRLLPVRQQDSWELHYLWLGDMPPALRQAVRLFRIRSLDPTVGFTAAIGDLMAVISEPLQDIDAALLKRLDRRFQITSNPTSLVVAIVDLPESPGDRTLPHILITPWAVHPQRERGGSSEIIDNYTREGAFTRSQPWLVDLDFAIDVYAQDRAQKARLLDEILRDFSREPFLVVNGERITIVPFIPAPEESTKLASPGRTPLFYRLTTSIETSDRQFQNQAVPFLQISARDVQGNEAINDRAASEAVRL